MRLSGSVGTDLQTSSTEGSKFWMACFVAGIRIFVLCFPKLCKARSNAKPQLTQRERTEFSDQEKNLNVNKT